ncbi:prepilin peptidase [Nonomuraea endophytica]|uniref:Leader peptidase (Prepilin peptidase)/N-methyltransferase n=1 Tax=Nonomuraea endophytica TaxID=714136 RepID=A0A7W8EG76_9ACTN|nr:A24 family peptidase [Nonomuraea endophytica]MBB5078309.1 leader peptidase (prepilin peptidase)/N-methyltransferase [Nonomuraea endophytica]
MGGLLIAVSALTGLLWGGYVRAMADGFEAEPADTRAEARRALVRWPRYRFPPWHELAGAGLCALVVWRAGLPYLFFVLVGIALAVVDWRTSRLPDVLTLPAYPLLALTLVPTGEVMQALLGGVALAFLYGVLWFARPTAMGLGDVKLAGLIGMATGALGWEQWVAAALGGQVLGALYAVWLLATKRGGRDTEFPFGPFMLLGALGALCLGN